MYIKKATPLQPHLPPTAVSQALHDGVDLRLKHLGQLGAVFVDAGGLAVVQPGVVEHQPDILDVLPGLLVLPRVQLPLDGRQVHGVLHDVKVVLGWRAPQVKGNLRRVRGGREGKEQRDGGTVLAVQGRKVREMERKCVVVVVVMGVVVFEGVAVDQVGPE